jgi:hypothetical protein
MQHRPRGIKEAGRAKTATVASVAAVRPSFKKKLASVQSSRFDYKKKRVVASVQKLENRGAARHCNGNAIAKP